MWERRSCTGNQFIPELGLGPWAGTAEAKFGGLPEREFSCQVSITCVPGPGAPLLGAVWSRL